MRSEADLLAELAHAVGPEVAMLENELYRVRKSNGIGATLWAVSNAMGPTQPTETKRLNGRGEHYLVWIYPSCQVFIHVLDDHAVFQDRSRMHKWWRLRLRPGAIPGYIRELEKRLDRGCGLLQPGKHALMSGQGGLAL
ncbi:MAG: hypothetical protein ACYDHY_09605 [Acidiferrobacterales bacterium]